MKVNLDHIKNQLIEGVLKESENFSTVYFHHKCLNINIHFTVEIDKQPKYCYFMMICIKIVLWTDVSSIYLSVDCCFCYFHNFLFMKVYSPI